MLHQQSDIHRRLPSPFPLVTEEQVLWGVKGNELPAYGYKAIVNADTGRVYSIVSEEYQLITHENAIEQVEDILNASSTLCSYTTSTAFYNDGGRMRRTYTFPDIAVAITPSDLVNPTLHLFNSYDTSWPFIVTLGAFRLVCANGLVVGEKFLYIRKRHVFQLDTLHLKENIATALKRFEKQTHAWQRLTNTPLQPTVYQRIMKAMSFGKKATKEIKEKMAEEADDYNEEGLPILTLWIFFNVLTWYITHRAVSLNHRVEMEHRLRSAMMHFKRNK